MRRRRARRPPKYRMCVLHMYFTRLGRVNRHRRRQIISYSEKMRRLPSSKFLLQGRISRDIPAADPFVLTLAHPYLAAQMARCYILGWLLSALPSVPPLPSSAGWRLEDIFRKCMKAFGSLFSFLSFSISRDTMEREERRRRRAPSLPLALKKAPSTTPLLYSYLCPDHSCTFTLV